MLLKKNKKIKGGVISTNPQWPQDGDAYFWVRSDIGQVCCSEWSDEGPYHAFRKETGNCFRTRADARNAIDRVKTYISLKDV